MPWLETDVRDQRIQFVLAVRRGTAPVSAVCRAFGISRTTGYKWLRREAAAGSVAALADRSRRPHHSPHRTPAAVVARVGALRAHFGWGGAKLAPLLAAEGYRLTPRTIDRWIQREGWTRSDAAPSPAPHRFTHAAPNDLWQMDAKGAYPLADQRRCHTLSVLDDHSRFVVGLTPLLTLHTGGVRAALIRSFEHYGVPAAMLMDHGAPWWSPAGAGGLTRLGVFLLQQGIRVVFSAVRHPQTQGKVERFHRTLAERLRWVGVPTTLPSFTRTLAWFREEYNYLRPHAALGLTPPAHHFTPSRRPTARRRGRGRIPPGSRSAASSARESFTSPGTPISSRRRSAARTSRACRWPTASSYSTATCTCGSCIHAGARASPSCSPSTRRGPHPRPTCNLCPDVRV